jgi:hypothetical protein
MSGVGEGHPLASPAVEAASPGALSLRALCTALVVLSGRVRYGSGFKGATTHLKASVVSFRASGLRRTGRRFFVCPAKLGTKQDGRETPTLVKLASSALSPSVAPAVARHYRRRNKKGANGDLCPGMPFKGGCLGQNENERRPIPTTTEGTGQRSKASSGKPLQCTEQVGLPLPKK